MLEISTVATVGYYFFLVMVLRALYVVVAGFWWGERGTRPFVHHQPGSRLCQRIVDTCSTLQESYTPPFLWGKSGHVQTLMFGMIGRFSVPEVRGLRHHVVVEDGSTVTYDLFEKKEEGVCITHTIVVCPGIGNSSKTDYIKSFASYGMTRGFRVAVLNHLGVLEEVPLTGNRIYTYGGTGDFTAMFDDLRVRYPDNRFIGVGFSLGACILVRFLGEDAERHRHFVCAASICQGYDPFLAAPSFSDWAHLRRLYNSGITKGQLRLLRRHSDSLFQGKQRGCIHSKIKHGGRDCNGFSLDPSKIQLPDETKLWSVNSMKDLDEYFTSRVMGFESALDLYRWTSCSELMYRIADLPMLFVNTKDDPLVPEHLHSIPKEYVGHNPNAMFVRPEYGGHLGFFEGGIITANPVSWIDRFLLEYAQNCIQFAEKLK